jgi:hypothetical protein
MTTFPNSLRLLKGGIVLLNPETAAVRRIISLQYNPDTLTRSLQVQRVSAEGGDRSEVLRLKGPPIETFKARGETRCDRSTRVSPSKRKRGPRLELKSCKYVGPFNHLNKIADVAPTSIHPCWLSRLQLRRSGSGNGNLPQEYWRDQGTGNDLLEHRRNRDAARSSRRTPLTDPSQIPKGKEGGVDKALVKQINGLNSDDGHPVKDCIEGLVAGETADRNLSKIKQLYFQHHGNLSDTWASPE